MAHTHTLTLTHSHRIDNSLIETTEALPALKMVDLQIHTAQIGLETVPRLLHLEVEMTAEREREGKSRGEREGEKGR